MCKIKLQVLTKRLREEIRKNKDYTGCIGHTELKMLICRGHHVPKCEVDEVFKELKELNIITLIGRNQLGVFYKVN